MKVRQTRVASGVLEGIEGRASRKLKTRFGTSLKHRARRGGDKLRSKRIHPLPRDMKGCKEGDARQSYIEIRKRTRGKLRGYRRRK